MRLSRPQQAFAASKDRFPAFVGGFGSGKTHAGILRAVSLKSQMGQDVAYYLPTYDLVRTIAFPRFCEMMSEFGIRYRLNKNDAEILTPDYGGKILFRTMDTPERIVGYEVAHSVCDELDTLPVVKARDVWNKVIARNRQKGSTGNTAAVATTPEGFRFVYERWKKTPKPGYVLYKSSTMDNAANLPDGYIDSLRDTYPAHLLDAYLEGEFVNMESGRVYPDFDRFENHCETIAQAGEPLLVGMDFNVNNMAAVVYVTRENNPHAVDELVGLRDTPAMAAALKDRYPGHSLSVIPDASGGSTSSKNASESDLSILRSAGLSVRAPSSNPRVRDRVNAMNALINSEKGGRRMRVNTARCPVLTEALEQQAWDKQGKPDKSTGVDHVVDAAGYPIAARWPVVKPLTSIKLGMAQ